MNRITSLIFLLATCGLVSSQCQPPCVAGVTKCIELAGFFRCVPDDHTPVPASAACGGTCPEHTECKDTSFGETCMETCQFASQRCAPNQYCYQNLTSATTSCITDPSRSCGVRACYSNETCTEFNGTWSCGTQCGQQVCDSRTEDCVQWSICVPKATCGSVTCNSGETCELINNTYQCVVPGSICGNTTCDPQTEVCELSQTNELQCVPVNGSQVVCGSNVCMMGEICEFINSTYQCVLPGAACGNSYCATHEVCEYRNGNYECLPANSSIVCGSQTCLAHETCEFVNNSYQCVLPGSVCGNNTCLSHEVCEYVNGNYQCLDGNSTGTLCGNQTCLSNEVCEYLNNTLQCVIPGPACGGVNCRSDELCEFNNGSYVCVPANSSGLVCGSETCKMNEACEYLNGFFQCVIPGSLCGNTTCDVPKEACEFLNNTFQCVPVNSSQTMCGVQMCSSQETCEYINNTYQCVLPGSLCGNSACLSSEVCELVNGNYQCVAGNSTGTVCGSRVCLGAETCQMINNTYQCALPGKQCGAYVCTDKEVCIPSGNSFVCAPGNSTGTLCGIETCLPTQFCDHTASPPSCLNATHTFTPTEVPTSEPTATPTGAPVNSTTAVPAVPTTGVPTAVPVSSKTAVPTGVPSVPATSVPVVPTTIAPTAAPAHLPCNDQTDCPAGEVCISESGSSKCVATGCGFTQCPVGEHCKQTPSGPVCEAVSNDPCNKTTCGANEVCVLNSNNTAVCEKVVTDPCAKCSATQKCSIDNMGAATCQDIDSCTLERRKLNLDDCAPPSVCTINNKQYPECVKPSPNTCDEAACKLEGKVCGTSGACIVDKCAEFSWPPAGVVFCDVNGDCKGDMKCTGCTVSGYCDSATGEKTFGHDCRPTCETFTLNCNASNLTPQERKTCCSVEGIGCDSYDCVSSTPVEDWSADQKAFCCKESGRGCPNQPDVKFDCFDTNDVQKWTYEKRVWCCAAPRSIGCPVIGFDCSGDNSTWSASQSEYCCKEFGKSCTPTNGFDCTWSNTTSAPWDDVQKEWCCVHEGVRCPPKDPFTCNGAHPTTLPVEEQKWCCANKKLSCQYNCQQKKAARTSWTQTQREYCCLYEGIGCQSNTQGFDCFDTSVAFQWSEVQKKYCCFEEDVGCPIDCTADKSTLSSVQQTTCCESNGRHCSGEKIQPVVPAVGERKMFRFSFRADWTLFSRNPIRMVRKFRMSLFAASKTLQSSPSILEVSYLGALMSDNQVPSDNQKTSWGINALLKWNTDSAIPDVIKNAVTASRTVNTLSETMNEAINAKDGAYFDYYLTGDLTTVDTIQKEINEQATLGTGSAPKGAFQNNFEGYSLILSDPTNELIETKGAAGMDTPSPPDSDDDKSWLWILLAAVGGFCLIGGLVVALVMKKRCSDNDVYVDNLEMHEGLQLGDDLVVDSPQVYEKVSNDGDTPTLPTGKV
eukprot:TRINITY_DN1488_c4_g1_i1.p1 TRINITY_DN1488_c4_g1~~TRINITY_DN1488_c4_g1_i1.p1  ORF type:complete len:1438 (+),score=287.55 TRINITY_DN1488_c4_g1_i1:75-4388(+)